MSPPSTKSAVAAVLVVLGVIAFLVRLLPAVASGSIANRFEYDGGVMLGATLRLLSGSIPYADFAFLHPPGSLILYAPAASVSDAVGEHGAFAVLLVATAIVGVGNVLLVALLLSRLGIASVIVGAGICAVWPVIVFTERQVMLEPILNLCLLGALLALRTGRDGRPPPVGAAWIAGALIGIALGVKYWAVVDVLLIAAVVVARLGVRGLWRYVAAGTMAAGAILLPFFIRAPDAMWEQTVMSQLARPATGTGLAERMNTVSAVRAAPWLDRIFPWWAWAILVGAALVLAVIPLLAVLRARQSPRAWPDPVWWGSAALLHAAVIAISASFYDHYAAWALPPIALVTGYSASLWSRGRIVTVASVCTITAIAATQVAIPAVVDLDPMRTWARDQTCVWADATSLIAANAFRRNIAAGCPMTLDAFGTQLTLYRAMQGDADSVDAALDALFRTELDDADAAIVGPRNRWMSAETAELFRHEFSRVNTLGDTGLWQRSSPAGD